jgi:PAS domain S-box-containing protein
MPEHFPITLFITTPMSEMLTEWWNKVKVPHSLTVVLMIGGFFIYRLTLRQERGREIERWNSTQSLNGLNTFNNTGDLVRGVDTDMTEHRQMEENLRISEQKLREAEIKRQSDLINSLLDSIPDIIFFKDINGVYLDCNPAFAEFVGKSRDEIVGMTSYDLFDKDITDAFMDNDKRMLELGRVWHNEEWITYPDGRKILLHTAKSPYLGQDGTLIGLLGISRDITDRKLAEENLLLVTHR